jgi:hypothetical protein
MEIGIFLNDSSGSGVGFSDDSFLGSRDLDDGSEDELQQQDHKTEERNDLSQEERIK